MKHENIAIIGGGIAGIYAAWRLIKADKTCKVHLFEAGKELGGRIKSVLLPGLSFKAELGAMRFRSNHLLLRALIDELEIPYRKFDVRAPRLQVRGRSLSAKELADGYCRHCGAGAPYLLRPGERGKSAEDLVLGAIRALLHDLSFPDLKQGEAQRTKQKILDQEFSPSVWKDIKEHGWYDNTPLFKIGFWNLLQHYLSNEAFQLVHDALSLESVLGNWSAAEAIPWFIADFSSSELYMVPDGMQEVIVLLEQKELKLEPMTNGRNPTEFISSDGQCRVSKERHVKRCMLVGEKWSIYGEGDKEVGADFDAIIFAVPKAALQTIQICRGDDNPWKPAWLDQVQAHVLYKLFLLYEHEWWMGDDAPGYSVGRTYTDLPVRQVYYFSPKWMQECAKVVDPKSQIKKNAEQAKRKGTEHWSLVMASYSDEHYVNFWRTFSDDPDAPRYYKAPSAMKPAAEKRFRKDLEKIDRRLMATRRIVNKVQQQLIEIHGHHIPEPIVGLYKDWGDEPFGGGWHTWNVGTMPWKHQPFEDGGIYVCGEAYSAEQGWIEGALKTVEWVLLEMEIPSAKYKIGRGVTDIHGYVGYDVANKRVPAGNTPRMPKHRPRTSPTMNEGSGT